MEPQRFLRVVADDAAGGIALFVPDRMGTFLIVSHLRSGIGSGRVNVDRGQPGKIRLVEWRRGAGTMFLVELNRHVTASAGPAAERAARESFAESVLCGCTIIDRLDGGFSIDVANLVKYDFVDVAGWLRQAGMGDYRLDRDLSYLHSDSAATGDRSVELAATLTFTGPPADALDPVVPAPSGLSLAQHVSLVKLPPAGFRPRRHVPMSGGYGKMFLDFSVETGRSPVVGYQPRFRLSPPAGTGSRTAVRDPVVFYVDPAVPEAYLGAVLDGGRWWSETFSLAGFEGGLRIEPLPDHVDPHAFGTSMIWWVNRAGRGWSYGAGLTDPRTGEIIYASVRLASQRVLQVRSLGEALLSPYGRADEAERLKMIDEFVLARIRQLAAHEIGHALGFMHNFASHHHARPSVMDYPYPHVFLNSDGEIDFSAAYPGGLGPWDEFLVRHAYGNYEPEDELAGLAELRREAAARRYGYVADHDGRREDSANPDGIPWVSGSDPCEYLSTVLAVRAKALADFSDAAVPPGEQPGEIERRYALVHLMHRYALAAVARLLGGVRYDYRPAGESGHPPRPVPAQVAHRALDQLTGLLDVSILATPAHALACLRPPAIRWSRDGEYYASKHGTTFDPVSAAEAAAAIVAEQLFEPARLNRLAWQHASSPATPGVGTVVRKAFAAVTIPGELPVDELVRRTARTVLDRYALAALRGAALHATTSRILAEALIEAGLDRDAVLRRCGDDSPDLPYVPPGPPL